MKSKEMTLKKHCFIASLLFGVSAILILKTSIFLPTFSSTVSVVQVGFEQKTEHVETPVESLSVMEIRQSLIGMGETPLYDADVESTIDPSEAWKMEIFQRLDRVRLVCGELCQLNSLETIREHTSIDPITDAPYVVVDNVNCPAILNSKDLDASSLRCKETLLWPDNVPEEIERYHSLDGATKLYTRPGRCDVYLTTKAGDNKLWKTGNLWRKEDIEVAMDEIREGTHFGSYGAESVSYVHDILKTADVSGKSILVIGSSAPWLEAILLVLGAEKVTTLEYGELISEHPQIVTMTPDVFRKNYQEGTLETFDGVVSHSSLEHSGLGRYGDAVNPWGDILAVARAWCVTKSGGWMYLGLPSGAGDGTFSNYHRLYARIRWPLVTTNWVPVHRNYTLNLDRPFEKGNLFGEPKGGSGFIFRKLE